MCFEREMASVVEMHLCARDVALERLRAGRQKEGIVLTPHSQQRWPLCAEVLLKLGIQRHIARVVQEEVELDLIIPRPSQQRGVELVRLRRHERLILHTM